MNETTKEYRALLLTETNKHCYFFNSLYETLTKVHIDVFRISAPWRHGESFDCLESNIKFSDWKSVYLGITNSSTGDLLCAPHFICAHCSFGGEVKAQTVWSNQRAPLVCLTQHWTQGKVKDVCGGMIAHDGPTTCLWNRGGGVYVVCCAFYVFDKVPINKIWIFTK